MEGRERVSVIHGSEPIIIVCPHGADDTNTDIVAESCATALSAYAVINRGFERNDTVDVLKDLADCNRVDHVTQEVVDEEFLNPILKFKKMCRKHYPNKHTFIYYIHGFGNQVEREAGARIDIILGYGEAEKYNSYTCELWQRNLFIECYRAMSAAGDVFVGRAGGKYAARATNNMNQYFRKHQIDKKVDSMQVEIALRLRQDEAQAKMTGVTLAAVFGTIADSDGFDRPIDEIFAI